MLPMAWQPLPFGHDVCMSANCNALAQGGKDLYLQGSVLVKPCMQSGPCVLVDHMSTLWQKLH